MRFFHQHWKRCSVRPWVMNNLCISVQTLNALMVFKLKKKKKWKVKNANGSTACDDLIISQGYVESHLRQVCDVCFSKESVWMCDHFVALLCKCCGKMYGRYVESAQLHLSRLYARHRRWNHDVFLSLLLIKPNQTTALSTSWLVSGWANYYRVNIKWLSTVAMKVQSFTFTID